MQDVEEFISCLRLPVIAAPMFLASGPELVIECCRAGIIGSFPSLNQRTTEGLDEWLMTISGAVGNTEQSGPAQYAPHAVNLIVHRSNPRLRADLEVVIKHRVPLVITSLGANADIVSAVHAYGGKVFHDVTNIRHARKAAGAGVDGLIAVAAGAGGHAGTINPFALVNEIRRFFDKTLVLAGCLSTGGDVAAAITMGADLAYIGTRFIATAESRAVPEYKASLQAARAKDIVYTAAVSGIPASFLGQSLADAGIDPAGPPVYDGTDIALELVEDDSENSTKRKPWRDVWSAGQGVGSIDDQPPVAGLVARLELEFNSATARFRSRQN
jgi:nitronate monooxygenase